MCENIKPTKVYRSSSCAMTKWLSKEQGLSRSTAALLIFSLCGFHPQTELYINKRPNEGRIKRGCAKIETAKNCENC